MELRPQAPAAAEAAEAEDKRLEAEAAAIKAGGSVGNCRW